MTESTLNPKPDPQRVQCRFSGWRSRPPTVITALVNALRAKKDLKHIDMPASRQDVWRALAA